jgi:hypothetical protein
LVPACPESPPIGYATPKNRMKRWADVSLMEGWFRKRERPRWNAWRKWVLRPLDDRLTRLSCRSTRTATADAGRETSCSQRDGEMCLDSLPYGRG